MWASWPQTYGDVLSWKPWSSFLTLALQNIYKKKSIDDNRSPRVPFPGPTWWKMRTDSPCSSYNLSAASSIEISKLAGEGFGKDIPLMSEYSEVFHSLAHCPVVGLCASSYLIGKAASLEKTRQCSDLCITAMCPQEFIFAVSLTEWYY